jgi:hypothetical protein
MLPPPAVDFLILCAYFNDYRMVLKTIYLRGGDRGRLSRKENEGKGWLESMNEHW